MEFNIKQKYLEQQERRDRNKDKVGKEGPGAWSMNKSREYPAALFSHKSKTFKMNKRRGL